MLCVKENTERKYRHNRPLSGIIVGVAFVTRMWSGLDACPKWNAELINWVRHLSVSVCKERMVSGHSGDFWAVVCYMEVDTASLLGLTADHV